MLERAFPSMLPIDTERRTTQDSGFDAGIMGQDSTGEGALEQGVRWGYLFYIEFSRESADREPIFESARVYINTFFNSTGISSSYELCNHFVAYRAPHRDDRPFEVVAQLWNRESRDQDVERDSDAASCNRNRHLARVPHEQQQDNYESLKALEPLKLLKLLEPLDELLEFLDNQNPPVPRQLEKPLEFLDNHNPLVSRPLEPDYSSALTASNPPAGYAFPRTVSRTSSSHCTRDNHIGYAKMHALVIGYARHRILLRMEAQISAQSLLGHCSSATTPLTTTTTTTTPTTPPAWQQHLKWRWQLPMKRSSSWVSGS